jgi:hypothetical protein
VQSQWQPLIFAIMVNGNFRAIRSGIFSQPAKKFSHCRLKCTSQHLIQTPKLWIEEIGQSYLFTHPTGSFGNERDGLHPIPATQKAKVMPAIKHCHEYV